MAFDAQLGFHRASGVINTRVQDLAVARTATCADGIRRFQNPNAFARGAQGQSPCYRQAHHTRAYDDGISVHGRGRVHAQGGPTAKKLHGLRAAR